MSVFLKPLKLAAGSIFLLTLSLAPRLAFAQSGLLELSIENRVSDAGEVTVFLALKNVSDRPLFHIHPMFHFHHTMSMMPMRHKLEAGASVTLENTEHPPVLRTGRYPLIAMAQFKTAPDAPEVFSRIHTSSFIFKEPVVSVIGGEMETEGGSEAPLLRIMLENKSAALKNIRLMLLLPPGLMAENFQKMMGVTLRGGERKIFEVPVSRGANSPDGRYPVHLMIEYAEMLNHYTGEIPGKIDFGAVWDSKTLPYHLLAIALASALLFLGYRKWAARRTGEPPAAIC